MQSQYFGNFKRTTKGSEEPLNQMVEALSITIDRRPKGKPCKMES